MTEEEERMHRALGTGEECVAWPAAYRVIKSLIQLIKLAFG